MVRFELFHCRHLSILTMTAKQEHDLYLLFLKKCLLLLHLWLISHLLLPFSLYLLPPRIRCFLRSHTYKSNSFISVIVRMERCQPNPALWISYSEMTWTTEFIEQRKKIFYFNHLCIHFVKSEVTQFMWVSEVWRVLIVEQIDFKSNSRFTWRDDC